MALPVDFNCMKLVALTNFRNNIDLDVETPTHPMQIDKGTVFSIGGDASYEKLNARDKNLVAALNFANRLGDGADPKTLQAVKREVEMDREREAKLFGPQPVAARK
jgi:hypothetical protein